MNVVRASAPIGREVELEELARVVGRNRVVSMTGAPGVGKTAVAAAFASTRASIYCSLHGVEGDDATCREIARALGLPNVATATTAETTSRVGRAIASRGKTLMILDDADLARAALTRLVPAWEAEAPSARFVIAARSRVAITGAQRFDLGPLEVPAANERDHGVIAASAAVRLFVRCASAVRPDYRLSAESAPHVAAIVRTLAGLPLAIELCASRVLVLGERELATLLAERVDALDAGASAAGGRTLRGAFALSWDQLAPDDARVLAACAVFRGSFDLDGASAVTAEPRLRTAEALERLEEASLVRAFEPEQMPGGRRYALDASVRAFAADRLSSGARDETTRRHAEHYGAMAGRGEVARPEVLALDAEDLEAALVWATSGRHTAMAARVALALAPLALSRGPLVPFLDRVDVLLDDQELPTALSAELHLVRGLARIHHGRRDDALADLAIASERARRSGNLRVEVLAASKTGLVVGMKGDFRGAGAHFSTAAELLEARAEAALPDTRARAALRGVVSKDLANVLSEEGKNAEAMIELARARDLFHEAGDIREEGFVLMMLGSRLLDEGQLEDARRDCGAGLELLRAAGDRRSTGWCQTLLALVDGERGDLRAARTRLDGALATFRVIGDAHTEGLVLGYLGNVALEQGALADAESLYRDARARLADVGDAGSEAMVTAAAGLVDVALGRMASARERFMHARSLARGDGREARREALAIMASVLDEPPKKEKTAKRAIAKGASTTSRPEEVRFAERVVASVRARVRAKPRSKGIATSPRERSGENENENANDNVLVIAPDGSWLRTPSARVAKFGAGGALRGIVRRLALDRVRYPGRPITLGALVRAGWPGEAILPAAAKNRLHVTIARLRRAGLAEILVHDEDGYLLDPAIAARFADDDERA